MDIRLLKYFCTIAEEKSISRAANVLHITQPTLSRQLKDLEISLDTKLFYREQKEMHLTEAGIFLKNRAEEILYLTEQTEKDFIHQKAILFSGHISIGCVEADNSDTLAMMLEELISDYPQVTFNIFSGTSDNITDQLDKGLIDLAILLEPINTTKYKKITLPRDEEWGILVSNQSFLSKKKRLEPKDLIGVPLLCSGRPEIQKMLANWMNIVFDEINVIGTFNLIFNIIPLVENRVANALTIKGAGEDWNTKNVTFIPLSPAIKTKCVVAWKKNRALSPVVNEFIQRMNYAFKA